MVNDEKIWFSIKENNECEEASFLSGILNTGWVMGIAPANKSILYLCGEVNKVSGILSSKPIDGEYTQVKKVIDGVHPYISPDESYIVYDKIGANWEETYLCIRFKNVNGQWGDEIIFPESINATKTECFGRMSNDEKYFFFNRIVNGNGDIYWVSSKIIVRRTPSEKN